MVCDNGDSRFLRNSAQLCFFHLNSNGVPRREGGGEEEPNVEHVGRLSTSLSFSLSLSLSLARSLHDAVWCFIRLFHPPHAEGEKSIIRTGNCRALYCSVQTLLLMRYEFRTHVCVCALFCAAETRGSKTPPQTETTHVFCTLARHART